MILTALGIKSFFKKHWAKILVAVIIALLTGGVTFLWNRAAKMADDRDRLQEVVFKKTIEYTDAQGRHVTESTEQRLRISELEQLALEGDSVKKQLLTQLKYSNTKLKNVESMAISTLFVHDTLWVADYYTWDSIPDSVPVKKFRNDYFDCINLGDTAMICDYKDTLIWSVSRYHKDKFKFINLFKRRDWYYKLTAKYLNPNARINYQEYIRIPAKKRDRRED